MPKAIITKNTIIFLFFKTKIAGLVNKVIHQILNAYVPTDDKICKISILLENYKQLNSKGTQSKNVLSKIQ